MARRIEVELTSERGDGTWTWRAAGARQPKGVLDGALLYPGAKVGDVLRAEADFDVEGITVTSVLPPKGARTEPERLELIGPQREFAPVTSTLTGREERANRRERDRGERGDRPGGPGRRDRPSGDRPGGDRRPSTRPSSPSDRRSGGPPVADGRPDRGPAAARSRPAPPPPRPKPKKLRPGRTHRSALVASLPPEQQAVADQLLQGGMPAVRTALEEQNSAARAAGTPEVPAETLLAMGEALLPRVRVADWLDRAEAALVDVDELALRDIRSVVVSADEVARDESTRELASRLREVLERRTTAEQADWLADVRSSLDGSRVVRALRLSSRPPEAGAALPADLTTRLTEAASAAMTADIASDRFATLVDAVAYSPVRRAVVPAGVPAEPDEELLAAARKHAGRVPSIATALGVEAPPETSRGARRRPSRPTAAQGATPGTATATTGAAPRPLPAGIRRIPPPPLVVGPDGRRMPPPPPPFRPGAPPVPPVEAVPAEPAPVDVTPPVEAAPAEPAPTDVTPPVEAAPAEPAPTDVTPPVEAAPAEPAPVDATPPGEVIIEPDVAAPAPPDDGPAGDPLVPEVQPQEPATTATPSFPPAPEPDPTEAGPGGDALLTPAGPPDHVEGHLDDAR